MPKRVLVLDILTNEDNLERSLIVFASIKRESLSFEEIYDSNWESISNCMSLLLDNPVMLVPMSSNLIVSGNAQNVIGLESLIINIKWNT